MLATITVQGQKPGSAYLHLHNDVVDWDTGGAIPQDALRSGSGAPQQNPKARSVLE